MSVKIDFKKLWLKFLANRAKRLGCTVEEVAKPFGRGSEKAE